MAEAIKTIEFTNMKIDNILELSEILPIIIVALTISSLFVLLRLINRRRTINDKEPLGLEAPLLIFFVAVVVWLLLTET